MSGGKWLTRDRAFYQSFLRLCLTLMLEQAVILSVNLADNMMLGAYSEEALSGVAAVNQIQFVYQQLVYGVTNGLLVLGTQYWGQKRVAEIRRLSAIGLRLETALAVVLFVLVSVFSRPALRIFTPNEAFIAQGVDYLRIVRFSYPFFALTALMLGTMRMVESVRIALRVSIISLCLNVAINYLLIFGRLGAPEMGVRGAAVGTLAARAAECVIVAVHMFRREKTLDIHLRDYRRIDRAMLRDVLRVGTPVLITSALWGVSNALQTVILGHMSDSAISAQSISSTVFLLLKVTAVGAASAASVMIGRTVGTGDIGKVREYSRTLQAMFLCIGAVLALMMLSLRRPLLRVYRVSDETRALADAYMIIQSVVLFTMSYQMPVNTGIIRGGGDTRFVLWLDLISIWGIVMPLSLLGAFVWHWPPVAVIICLNADQCFKCVPAFLRVRGDRWIKRLTRAA
ncbi:MAG: MATE family efflux transporter [Clostridiales bacterium]|nr:MATE family efflux transporter [Clostridiales bacterium]